MLVPRETRTGRLVGAAAIVHGVLSLGWTCVIARTLPRDAGRARSTVHGVLMGAAVAGLDLGIAHALRTPRFAAIRELPVRPQVADHLAFGAVAGFVLRRS
jgi:high-affinity Fe2+/Pb2+ permease